MSKNRLKKERREIDKIDQQIFSLIKKRTFIVKKMLKLKKFKHEIVDHKRNKEILTTLKKKSIRNKIDPKITLKIWKSIISAYIDYEFRNFKKK